MWGKKHYKALTDHLIGVQVKKKKKKQFTKDFILGRNNIIFYQFI